MIIEAIQAGQWAGIDEMVQMFQGMTTGLRRARVPVVTAPFGFTFGGGCEIAMACTARISWKGLKILAGQPEPKLGIIPGYGGTQRLPRWVGLKHAWPLLRTGNPISSNRALEIGLIYREVEKDLTGEAISLARAAAFGDVVLPAIQKDPLEIPGDMPDVDIGHLSRKIDELIQKAVLDGAGTTLEEGLKIEAKVFGECLLTEDMRIGMENFLKNGPRVDADFLHR
jgi:enoyl-CoA hydratase/carnithine racemase